MEIDQNIYFVGRRGNSGDYNKNSLKAVLSCSNDFKVDGVTIDIRMTSDNKLVSISNKSLRGITNNGSGLIINKSLEAINKFQFKTPCSEKSLQLMKTIPYLLSDSRFIRGYWKTIGCSEPIITLDDVLDVFDYDKRLVINIVVSENEYNLKQQEQFENSLIRLLKQYHFQKYNIFLQSYDIGLLLIIKNKLPNLKIGIVIDKEKLLSDLKTEVDFINLNWNLINPLLIEKIMKYNLEVCSHDYSFPVEHYKKINEILCIYKNSGLSWTVETDFPHIAREKILMPKH